MRILTKISTAFVAFFITTQVMGQSFGNFDNPESQEFSKRQLLPNGQTVIVNKQNFGNTVFTDIYFRVGSAYEYDSLNGISLAIAKIVDKKIKNSLQKNNQNTIVYSSTVIPSQISFSFQSDLSQLNLVLKLIEDKILFFKADSILTQETIAEITNDLDNINRNDDLVFQKKIDKKLWQRDFRKVTIYGDERSYLKITADDLNVFHRKYFLPSNSAITFIGNIKSDEVINKVSETFKDFISTEFNPEQIIRVLESRPIVNVNQLLFTNNKSELNEAAITYQNPGARVDRVSSYCAFLLTSLLNDRNGKYQKTANLQEGLKEMKAVFDCGNFYSTFKIYTKNSNNNFITQFNYLAEIFSGFNQKDFLNDGELEIAKKNIEIELKELKTKNPRSFTSKVAQYRFLNDENYFNDLNDSIQRISIPDMNNFIHKYFSNYAGVRSLKTTEAALQAAPENQKYLALDESVKDLMFTYEQNKTDLEGDSNIANQQLLLRWLQINPDMHIQLNGYADEGEYDRATDKVILDFIDSIPTFRKVKQDLVKKGYLKLEMMRAMKIAKFLFENGITEDRLNGTSMIFTSDSKEAAIANRKCTVTLEKIKPRLSLYEYHFGKKKQE